MDTSPRTPSTTYLIRLVEHREDPRWADAIISRTILLVITDNKLCFDRWLMCAPSKPDSRIAMKASGSSGIESGTSAYLILPWLAFLLGLYTHPSIVNNGDDRLAVIY